MQAMSKILSWVTIFLLLAFSFQLSYAQEVFFDQDLEDAVQWMYTNDLTRYDDIEDYRPADTLSRQEAAKFFWNFALFMEKSAVKWADECQFNDVANADYTLTSHILSSCQLGIFQWSEGRFMPFDTITRAEALTVVIRTIEWFQDENIDPRRFNYHKTARQLWITNENDVYALDMPITRYEIALIIHRASGQKWNTIDPSQLQLSELADLLLALGLQSN